uniref:Uncharacterized protein n=1 Tax=Moniliophthora roreri TaxID=221103 RepID=A0A0W0GAP2_MONRR
MLAVDGKFILGRILKDQPGPHRKKGVCISPDRINTSSLLANNEDIVNESSQKWVK